MPWLPPFRQLSCCGIQNASDWVAMPYGQSHDPPQPLSCCRETRDAVCIALHPQVRRVTGQRRRSLLRLSSAKFGLLSSKSSTNFNFFYLMIEICSFPKKLLYTTYVVEMLFASRKNESEIKKKKFLKNKTKNFFFTAI